MRRNKILIKNCSAFIRVEISPESNIYKLFKLCHLGTLHFQQSSINTRACSFRLGGITALFFYFKHLGIFEHISLVKTVVEEFKPGERCALRQSITADFLHLPVEIIN